MISSFRRNIMKRCSWLNENDPLYVKYHDEEWGRPLHDDDKLYELFLLECFQAGLSWRCILGKRENFRKAYDGFDPKKIALYDDKKVEDLMADTGIIRNRRKIIASIKNTRVFLNIQKEFGSFDSYIWHFTDRKVIREPFDIRTSSPLSDNISKDLKKRGMSFVGTVTIYSFLQAAGIINGHGKDCDMI